MRRAGCALGLGLLLAWGAPVAAQETKTPPLLPESRWGKLGEADVGKRYALEGRWKEVYGSVVSLYKAPAAARKFLLIRDGPLKVNLTANQDRDFQDLEERASSVRITGVVRKGRTSIYLEVLSLQKLPDEDEQYRERLQKLGSDVDKIRELGAECARRAERFDDPRLRALVLEFTRRELDARRERLVADDFAGRMELAQRYLEEIQDIRGAIALYAEVKESGRAPAALRERAGQALQRQKAIRIREEGAQGETTWRWLPFEDYKVSEGFINRGSEGRERWIRKELAELEEARLAELERRGKQVETPRLEPHEHAKDAREGRVARGQTFYEVTVAAGLPVRVHHIVAPLENDPRAVWTQWVMADKRRVYFVHGEVISTVPPSQDWPSE